MFYYWIMKNHCLPYKSELPFPLSTQYDVENQKKSQVVVFNIVSWRGGGGEVRHWWSCIRVWVCAKAPKVHLCPRTFVLDFSFERLYSENRRSKLRKLFKLLNRVKMDTNDFFCVMFACLYTSLFFTLIVTFLNYVHLARPRLSFSQLFSAWVLDHRSMN